MIKKVKSKVSNYFTDDIFLFKQKPSSASFFIGVMKKNLNEQQVDQNIVWRIHWPVYVAGVF